MMGHSKYGCKGLEHSCSEGRLSCGTQHSPLWQPTRALAWAALALACAACGVGGVGDVTVPTVNAIPGVTPSLATVSSTPARAATSTEVPTASAPGATPLPETATVGPATVPPTMVPTPSATRGQPEVYVDLVEGNLDVFVRMADGAVLNLTNHPSADAYPALSPDGHRVLFVSNRDGPSHVFLVNIDGSGLVRLTDSGYGDTQPQWAPHGQCIAYQTLLPDHNWEIYSMQPDGSQKANLTNSPAIDVSPAWSPDGALIAFETNRDGDSEIYIMAADGSNPVNVTQNAAAYDISPVWSADGERILFRSDRDGARFEYRWYAISPDGTGPGLVEE